MPPPLAGGTLRATRMRLLQPNWRRRERRRCCRRAFRGCLGMCKGCNDEMPGQYYSIDVAVLVMLWRCSHFVGPATFRVGLRSWPPSHQRDAESQKSRPRIDFESTQHDAKPGPHIDP